MSSENNILVWGLSYLYQLESFRILSDFGCFQEEDDDEDLDQAIADLKAEMGKTRKIFF